MIGSNFKRVVAFGRKGEERTGGALTVSGRFYFF